MDAEVDDYIERSQRWRAEMAELRPILLGCGLTEQIKWGKPCYARDGRNVVILQAMRDFLALMFFRGALLADPPRRPRAAGPELALGPPDPVHVRRGRGPARRRRRELRR